MTDLIKQDAIIPMNYRYGLTNEPYRDGWTINFSDRSVVRVNNSSVCQIWTLEKGIPVYLDAVRAKAADRIAALEAEVAKKSDRKSAIAEGYNAEAIALEKQVSAAYLARAERAEAERDALRAEVDFLYGELSALTLPEKRPSHGDPVVLRDYARSAIASFSALTPADPQPEAQESDLAEAVREIVDHANAMAAEMPEDVRRATAAYLEPEPAAKPYTPGPRQAIAEQPALDAEHNKAIRAAMTICDNMATDTESRIAKFLLRTALECLRKLLRPEETR